jgi:predicted nucleic acid-binding protein
MRIVEKLRAGSPSAIDSSPPTEETSEEPESSRDEQALQIWYVESSALVAAFVEGDVASRAAIRSAGRHVTSAITLTEAQRATVRLRTTGRIDPEDARRVVRGLQRFERRCDIVPLNDEILARAGRPFPVEPVRTLDALHLATMELLGEPPPLVTVITRDARVAANARALGFVVAP